MCSCASKTAHNTLRCIAMASLKGLLFTVIDAPVACVGREVQPILWYVTCDCCVCEPPFRSYTRRYRLLKCLLTAGTIFYDRYRNTLRNKMAAPEASSHPVKNRLCYLFAVYRTNESCSQRCSRRIILLSS